MDKSIKQFEQFGFCVKDNLIANDTLDYLMGYLQELVDVAIDYHSVSCSIKDSLDAKVTYLYKNHPKIAGSIYDTINMSIHAKQIFDNDLLLNQIAQLLKIDSRDLLINNVQFFIKPKGTEHYLGWHQDSSYFEDFNSDNSLVCWIPLVDVNKDNGAIWTIPSSHKSGKLNYNTNEKGNHKNIEWDKRGLTYIDKEKFDESKAVQLEVKKGEVAFFDFNLIHKSGLQISENVRYTVLARFGSSKSKIKFFSGEING